jgi:putative ABC transport system ATP-binding protein
MVFQDANLFPWLSIEDNIALPLELKGMDKARRRARAQELCQLVGIKGFEKRWPRELSGGMRQRAAIARALANDPALILADEPTGNLDRGNGTAVMDLLFGLRARLGTTLLLITHDPALAERCPRQIRIEDGRIVSDTAKLRMAAE